MHNLAKCAKETANRMQYFTNMPKNLQTKMQF